jgi:very-short-patch-repair endonuclease
MHLNSHYNKDNRDFARKLRRKPTNTERILWELVLRKSQVLGVKFQRQRPVDVYIADFMCLPLGIIIEADGITHEWDKTIIKDAIRNRRLIELGYKILRFTDDEILDDFSRVKNQIIDFVDLYLNGNN